MKNYLPTTTPGDARRRANTATVMNTDGETPSVTWYEEDRINRLDGGASYERTGSLISTFEEDQLDEEILLIDQDSGETVGKTTRGMVMLGVTSLYIHDAQKRDKAK